MFEFLWILLIPFHSPHPSHLIPPTNSTDYSSHQTSDRWPWKCMVCRSAWKCLSKKRRNRPIFIKTFLFHNLARENCLWKSLKCLYVARIPFSMSGMKVKIDTSSLNSRSELWLPHHLRLPNYSFYEINIFHAVWSQNLRWSHSVDRAHTCSRSAGQDFRTSSCLQYFYAWHDNWGEQGDIHY